MYSFGGAAALALVASFFFPHWLHGVTRFVAGYDIGVLVLLASQWAIIARTGINETRERAAAHDPGRNIVLLVVLGAVVVGLVAAIAIIAHGPPGRTAAERWQAYGLGIVAIFAGWALVHTVYTFRYAHLFWFDYNQDGKPGGIHFPGTQDPGDWDFAYFSFCVGTSFAVSDPQVTSTLICREVLWHSIISFLYNSVIVGMMINLFAGIFATNGSS